MINLANLNPLLTKELRGRMRGWRSMAVLTFYLLILGGLTWIVYALTSASAQNSSDLTSAQFGKVVLGAVVFLQLAFVCLLAPAFTAGIITGERERQTYDILMTTLLRPRQIILGKLGAALAWLLLLIMAVVPISSLSFVLGGVAPEELILSLVVVLAAAYCYGAVGLLWSSLVKSTVAAVVLALVTLAMVLAVVPVIYFATLSFVIVSRGGIGPSSLSQSPPAQYLNELFLSCHPLYALARSEAYLLENKGIFIVETTMSGTSVWLPHPWLVFTIFSLLMGTLLVAMAIRNLSPTRRRRARYAADAAPPAPAVVRPPAPSPASTPYPPSDLPLTIAPPDPLPAARLDVPPPPIVGRPVQPGNPSAPATVPYIAGQPLPPPPVTPGDPEA